MPRYFLEVMYDGTAFHGSQLQGNTATVQLAINSALQTLFRMPVTTFGASRTDEGVHALCNYYHFDHPDDLPATLVYRINALLPPALAVKNIYRVADEANARFDAINRRYRYRIYTQKNPFLFQKALYYPLRIDMDLLHQTAAILKEYTDFETFSKRNTQTKTMRCTLFHSAWEHHNAELHYLVTGNRFLRGMVRGLVGTQLQVARGRYTLQQFRDIIEAKDCTRADFSVAGHGLYLEDIEYPEGTLRSIG